MDREDDDGRPPCRPSPVRARAYFTACNAADTVGVGQPAWRLHLAISELLDDQPESRSRRVSRGGRPRPLPGRPAPSAPGFPPNRGRPVSAFPPQPAPPPPPPHQPAV